MLSFLALTVAFATIISTTTAHYTFPNLLYMGTQYPDYTYIRRTWNYQNYYPLFDLTSPVLQCFTNGSFPNPGTLTVSAGDTVGFKVSGRIIHEGPLLFYMAKAGFRQTAASMTGAGAVWVKINETKPVITNVPEELELYKWPYYNAAEVHIQIPPCLSTGDYLLRVEHIALHIAFEEGQHEFFGACAQLKVVNGGNGVPGPYTSFPGAYSSNDPGLFLDIHRNWTLPEEYEVPGPPVWSCGL
ncbi:hypothetical protein TWF970_010213 [Orbilia oligospora]|uniref:lytic cellulose monooxygenase (C4-dehydrogenating) n=1 Tax=Orbilia oligospora TaxID=2813651 RepID=A0A7C8V818_ORBOL|nr:hypothetical protein TWF970_010213 [Orbilia oligospora]